MTSNHDQKQLVRDRMAATGETYTQARQALEPEPPVFIAVSIDLGRIALTKEQQDTWLAAERKGEAGAGYRVATAITAAYLKRLQEDEEFLRESEAQAVMDELGIDVEDLDLNGLVDFGTYCQSELDAQYAAVHGHKARALGITIEEYRERERWLMTNFTKAEWRWLYSTGKFEDKPGSDYIHTRVDGELVEPDDEKLLQFLAEYREHVK